MTNKTLEKLLKEEKRMIQEELNTNKNIISFRSKKRVVLILTLLLVISSVVYAGVQLGIITWFMEQSHGYLDILDAYPQCKKSIVLEDDNYSIEVFGLVSDEEVTYIYIDMPESNLMIDQFEIINSDDVYHDLEENPYMENTFVYNRGMASVTNNQQVYKLRAFDLDEGVVSFRISNLVKGSYNEEQENIKVEMTFDIDFKKLESTSVKIDKEQLIYLPEIDEELTLYVDKIKFLPTATYVYFDLEEMDKVNLQLGDILINNRRLSQFLFGGEEDYISFYPMTYEDIHSLKWEIDYYNYSDYDLEMIPIEKVPMTVDYDGYNLVITSEIVEDYLTYTIVDEGFKNRAFTSMDIDIYTGNVTLAYNSEMITYEVQDDQADLINDLGDYLFPDLEKIRTETYIMKTHESLEALQTQPYYDPEDIELRIRHLNYTYKLDETIKIYSSFKNWIKNIF